MRRAKIEQRGTRRRPTRDRLRPQPKQKSPSWQRRNALRHP